MKRDLTAAWRDGWQPSSASRAAIEHARATAGVLQSATLTRIQELSGIGSSTAAGLIVAQVAQRGRITLNFHPDRLLADGRTVAEALLEDGRYRSQFETHISNGSRTAFPGGDRDHWEERLFGGAYHRAYHGPHQPPAGHVGERPKYGALDLLEHGDGGAPRFGSCHLRLRAEVSARSTFCFGDSYLGPTVVATLDTLQPVVAALLTACAETGTALGSPFPDVPSLLHTLCAPRSGGVVPLPCGRALDEYIEAQVHGDILLSRDAELLVIDPSFRDTPGEGALLALAERHDLPLAYHAGFVLSPAEFPDDFRGPTMAPLARRLVRELSTPDGLVSAETVGRGAASLYREPQAWRDWGSPEETLRQLKQLWHVLVRFGHPAMTPEAAANR